MSIAPCQSLFVAPCSHVWHYKCIRPILNGQTWPNFLCPNCRAVADLEADVEEYEDWDESIEIEQAIAASKNYATAGADRDVSGLQESTSADDGHGNGAHSIQHSADHLSPDMDPPTSRRARASRTQQQAQTNGDSDALSLSHPSDHDSSDDAGGLVHATSGLSLNDGDPQHQDLQSSASLSTPRPIPPRPGTARSNSSPETTQYALTPGTALHAEGPMTPRNDAGPFVLDGGAGQAQRGARGPTSRGFGGTG
jgi:E3 ubiquitin-protein ligase DMA1/2